jgi:hypothetical protein
MRVFLKAAAAVMLLAGAAITAIRPPTQAEPQDYASVQANAIANR